MLKQRLCTSNFKPIEGKQTDATLLYCTPCHEQTVDSSSPSTTYTQNKPAIGPWGVEKEQWGQLDFEADWPEGVALTKV